MYLYLYLYLYLYTHPWENIKRIQLSFKDMYSTKTPEPFIVQMFDRYLLNNLGKNKKRIQKKLQRNLSNQNTGVVFS